MVYGAYKDPPARAASDILPDKEFSGTSNRKHNGYQ